MAERKVAIMTGGKANGTTAQAEGKNQLTSTKVQARTKRKNNKGQTKETAKPKADGLVLFLCPRPLFASWCLCLWVLFVPWCL